MLRFFRRIRKELLDRGTTSKYLIYAVGEIMLVMIGILLALQVNNWNDNKKQRAREVEIIHEIRDDLNITKNDIKRAIQIHRDAIKSMQTIKSAILEENPIDDKIILDIQKSIQDDQAYPKTIGYNILKTIGFDLISNKSLRSRIAKVYDLWLGLLVDFGEDNEKYDIALKIKPFLIKHLVLNRDEKDTITFGTHNDTIVVNDWSIKDYFNFMNDEDFAFTLQEQMMVRKDKILLHESARKEIDRVLQLIELELRESK